MRLQIPRQTGPLDERPLTWFVRINGDQFRTVSIICENGHESTVGGNHSIAEDGTAEPSFVCMHSGCSWHVFVKLLGYDLQPKPAGQIEVHEKAAP